MSNDAGRRTSLVEVLCAGAVCVLVLGGLLVAAQQNRERDNRVRCAANLRMIGIGMLLYSNNETRNGQSFPRTQYKPGEPPRFFTNWKQPKSFGPGAPEANDVTAAFYLILKTQDLDPIVLHCPDSKSKELEFKTEEEDLKARDGQPRKPPQNPIANSPTDLSNFPGLEYMSYSYQNPYGSEHALASGFKWNVTIPADFALAADLNPGKSALAVKPTSSRKEMSEANSPNHAKAGQNILYSDGHVEWQQTPFAGPEIGEGAGKWNDNIYTARTADNQQTGGEINAAPYDNADNILLPAADYKAAEDKAGGK